MSTLTSLEVISKQGLFKLPVEQAHFEGTNVMTALKYDPVGTRKALVTLVGDVCTFLDTKRTLRNASDYAFTVETLLDAFPAMTLEDWRIVCERMKAQVYGDYFERLKVGEFRSAMLKYEEEIAPIRERRRTEHKITRGADDPTLITFKPQTMQDIRRKRNEPIFALAQHLIKLHGDNPVPSEDNPTGTNLEPDEQNPTEEKTGRDF